MSSIFGRDSDANDAETDGLVCIYGSIYHLHTSSFPGHTIRHGIKCIYFVVLSI